MITYGYAKKYKYNNDGTLSIQVRIPAIHGPYKQSEYRGSAIRNYILDKDLPMYSSVLLPKLPNEGDIVALLATNSSNSDFIVIGLTGGTYHNAPLSN